MNSNKIVNLLPDLNPGMNDALSYINAANIFMLNNTNLNYIANHTPTSGDVNLNSYKITNLANATIGTDGLNRDSGDSRYYQNTTPLNSITIPSGNVNMNAKKITNMADGTISTDAITY